MDCRTSFSSNQQATPVPWNGMKWMPGNLFIVRRNLLHNCKMQRSFWKSVNSFATKTLKTYLSMVSILPPTSISFIGNHLSHLRQPTYLPRSLKKWQWQQHVRTPGIIKIRDMENCHSVPIHFIGKYKSKFVSDFFISACLLWFPVWMTCQEGEG